MNDYLNYNFKPTSFNEQERSVEGIISTEKRISHFTFQYGFIDVIIISSGIQHDEKVKLLDTHRSSGVDGILGSATDFKVVGEKFLGKMIYSSIAEDEFTRVKEGHSNTLSISIEPLKTRVVEENKKFTYKGKEYEGPCMVITQSSLREVSSVALPANKDCMLRNENNTNQKRNMEILAKILTYIDGVKRNLPDDNVDVASKIKDIESILKRDDSTTDESSIKKLFDELNKINPKENIKELERKLDEFIARSSTPKKVIETPKDDVDEAKVIVNKVSERKRQILTLARSLDLEAEGEALLQNPKITLAESKVALYEKHAENSKSLSVTQKNIDNSKNASNVTVTEGLSRNDSIVLGLLHRSGKGKKLSNQEIQQGRDFHHIDFANVAKLVLGDNVSSFGTDGHKLFQRAMSSSDFSDLLSNLANKFLVQEPGELSFDWRPFCMKASVKDFKVNTLHSLAGKTSLKEKREGEDIQYGTVSTKKYPYQVKTFAEIFPFTRETFINDDLNALSNGVAGYASLARRVPKDLFFELLASTEDLDDSKPFFDSSRGNLASVASALSISSLHTGSNAMRKHKNDTGDQYLDIKPTHILIPIAQESNVRVLLGTSNYVDDNAAGTRINPFYNAFEVISSPYLDDALDANTWFLAVTGQTLKAFTMAFLNGQEDPFTEVIVNPVNDTIGFKVRLDCAISYLDPRLIYKNTGA